MSSLAQMLAELGDVELRDVEWSLARIQVEVQTGMQRVQWRRHFPWLKDRLSEAQGHRCCCCGKRMIEAGRLDDRPTLEHIVPLSEGGEDTPANLAVACFRCNTGVAMAICLLERTEFGRVPAVLPGEGPPDARSMRFR
jgi:hypothetical protein